jgi:transcriptional activator of cad operon
MSHSLKSSDAWLEGFAKAKKLQFGSWHADRDSGELTGPVGRERLEPKVMELLMLLASRPNQVCSKEEIMEQLWPGMILGEDTLARAVSKLRKSLADDVKSPRFVETLPKRGYRFICADARLMPSAADALSSSSTSQVPADVASDHSPEKPKDPVTPPVPSLRWIWLAGLAAILVMTLVGLGWIAKRPDQNADDVEVRVLIDRANDYYFQYTYRDNEAAIELFERVIAQQPNNSQAHAGLANAIAQRVLRWPSASVASGQTFTQLGDAIRSGHMRSSAAKHELQRASQLALRAVQLAPEDAVALKALGFVKSTSEDFAGALAAYQQAIRLDANAWGPMINIADIYQITGQDEFALPYLESAFAAMTRVYAKESARIRPWYADTAILIGERHFSEHRVDQAEQWYRRALDIAPFHLKASARLATLLRGTGRIQEAADLCARLQRRIGDSVDCVAGS